MRISKSASEKHRKSCPIRQQFEKIQDAASCKFSFHKPRIFHRQMLIVRSFLYGGHSEARLNITKKMLLRILTYHQVTPNYLNFLVVFGNHEHSREKRFSGFRGECMVGVQALAAECLGRSETSYQLCYNLKTIVRQTADGQLAPPDSRWSTRQCAIHHQFDSKKGNSLWIITRTGQEIKQRIEALTGKDGRKEDREFQTPEQRFKASLAVHLLLCYWSSENWRTYLQWLEDLVEREVSLKTSQITSFDADSYNRLSYLPTAPRATRGYLNFKLPRVERKT